MASYGRKYIREETARMIQAEGDGLADQLRERIAALEAEIEAAHRAIDSIGLSRCADSHEGRDANGRITCDDGKPPLSLAERVSWLIRWLSDDPYPMGPRIKALEAENAALHTQLNAEQEVSHSALAENAALKAERDEAKQSARRSAVEILAFMGALAECQRDDEVPHETALRIVDERNTAFTNLGEEISLRLKLEAELAAARQSRARLVRLVRALRAELTSAWGIEGQAEQEADAAEDRVRVLEDQLSEARRKIANQRDANRRLTEDAHRRKAELSKAQAERDAYRSQFWDKSIPDLVEIRKQRNAARAAFNVMDGCYKQAVAERDSETQWAHHYFTAWQTARQSRARLVRMVRYFKRVTGWAKTEYANAVATIESLQAELDAARAWAAAWKRAAKYERGYPASVTYDAGQDNDQTVVKLLQPMKRNR